jgi:hypothetical protein
VIMLWADPAVSSTFKQAAGNNAEIGIAILGYGIGVGTGPPGNTHSIAPFSIRQNWTRRHTH